MLFRGFLAFLRVESDSETLPKGQLLFHELPILGGALEADKQNPLRPQLLKIILSHCPATVDKTIIAYYKELSIGGVD